MFVLSIELSLEHKTTISIILEDFHEAMADLHQEVYRKGEHVLEMYYRMRAQIGRMEAIEHEFPACETRLFVQSVKASMMEEAAEIVDKIKIA